MNRVHPIYKSIFVVFLSLALLSLNSIRKHKYTNDKCDDNNNNNNGVVEYDDNFLKVNFSNKFDERVLYILGFFELSTEWGDRIEGKYELLAAKLAVKHVNLLDVLNGYKLELLVEDTRCDPGVGMDKLFRALYSEYSIFLLLGSGCSNVTQRLAQIVPHWNILQISFGSTSPSLSDRNKFPYFFRTATTDSSHNAAKVRFVKEFGWKVVATFTQNENEFLLPVNRLISDLEKADVICVASVTFSLDNFLEQLEVLKNLNVRIIFGSFSIEVTSKIICAVQSLGMLDKYVWILQERENYKWNHTTKCTLENDSNGIITVSNNNGYLNDCILIQTQNEEFKRDLDILKAISSPYPKYTYDAVWAFTFALQKFKNTDWFLYNLKKDIINEFMENLNSLTFFGLSGPLRFKEGDRVGNSMFRQLQGEELKNIAIFNSIKYKLDFNCDSCEKIIWKNNEVPVARRILKVLRVTIPNFIFISIILFSTLGIATSLGFLYFNFRFRTIKYVKLSSPNLTNITILGCILVYLSVILLGLHNSSIDLDSYFNSFCSVRVYLLSTGFSLTFGSIMAKTYRVHRLFTFLRSGSLKDKLLKDRQLIFLIFIPLVFDGFILSLWLLLDPLEKKIYNLNLEMSYGERGVDYQPQIEMCYSHNLIGWYVALLGYKTMFILMGTYMAWKTKNIKIPVLNDSQYIGICIYTTIFSTVIVMISTLISNHVIITYVIQSISILTATTIILFLMFLPTIKMVFGTLDTADPIMQSMGLTDVSNTRRFIFNDSREILHRLEIQNKVYRCHLIKLDGEINYLEKVIKNYMEKY